ncbi:hypothetical protein G7L54_23830, partial [Shigella sonnei]|uniref:hypothetical protein n=1 Tax=Shigella sonnei TaxID=624 RepID=UPI001C12C788
ALGIKLPPKAMGVSKQTTGTFTWGFISFALLALIAFVVLRIAQRKWTKVWVEKGGKARINKKEEIEFEIQEHIPGLSTNSKIPSYANGN